METRREDWIKAQREDADAYVDSLTELSDKLALIGTSNEEAQRAGALARIEDALPLDIAPTLTPLQHKAAFLLGKGIGFTEVEKELEMVPGEVYQTHQQSPEFRRAIKYYADVDKEELGGLSRQWVRIMLEDESIDDKVRASLLALGQKIGMEPSEERFKVIDRVQRQEQMEAQKEIAMHPSRLIGVQVNDSIDGDFEVEEVGSEKVDDETADEETEI